MFLAAAIALGVAGQADAQVIRDHRRTARPPVTRVDRNYRAPRHYHNYRYGSGGGYYYVNGLPVYDTPIGTPIRDPLYFRYPGVAAPRGPIEIVYDASGNFMFIAGYWEWYQGRWIYIDGYWAPARAGYYYEPGYWHQYNNSWRRQAGHWRRLPANRSSYNIVRRDTRITNERVPARRSTRFNRY